MVLIEELRRRNVLRAAALYIAVAWGATEILAFLIQALSGENAAAVASRYLAILFISGFPVAMYLAWTRDLGLQGRRIVGAAALAVVLVATLLWLLPGDDDSKSVRLVQPSGERTIAVLPLDNLSGDSDQDYFAAGMTEALISSLSRLGVFQVISRTSVMRYQGTAKTLPEIAGELGADTIVEGSVLRSGNRIRISAQLIDATTDHHLWADDFESEMEDVLGLQSDMAQQIARGIGASLGEKTLPHEKPRRVDPEAYDAYLQVKIRSLAGSAEPDEVISGFEHVIELDPTFAPAYASLADFYAYMAMVSNTPTGDAYLQSRQFARKAVELDPSLVSARVALARVHFQYEWDWAAAEQEFEKALELDPNSALALNMYGGYRTLIYADCREGVALMETSRDLDPFNPGHHVDLGVYTFHCRRFNESIAHLERATDLAPAFRLPRLILAWNYLMKGWTDRALQQCDAVTDEVGDQLDPIVLSSCAWVNGKAGRTEIAGRMLDRLRTPPPGIRVDPSWLAGPCVALGDYDCAIDTLDEAFRQRSSNIVFLRIAVQWDDIRGDTRFQTIVNRMNFPD
jgi:TolB-like protein